MFWKRAKPSPAEWLVVGLGNPGPQYRWTPHNMGFLTVDALAREAGIRVERPEENALVGRGTVSERSAVLAKPLSFMNLSGGPIKGLVRRYELPVNRLLVVYDELDLPWGRLRLRQKGSPAGHNGMKSIIASLGTSQFPRLRIGIHPGHPVGDRSRYLLRPLGRSRVEEVEGIAGRAADVVGDLLAEGAQKAMARCNRRALEPKE